MNLDVAFSSNGKTIPVTFSASGTTLPSAFGNVQTIHNGQNGATFTPSVSEDGVISWENDRELPNPDPVNIKGPKGDPGRNGVDGQPGKDGAPGQPGKDGVDGQPGADGVSPVVTVTAIDGGHRVTITDKNGAKQFDVMDGEDGKTPVKGTDYFTGADKAEMVNAVIAALPTWEGGSY